MFTHIINPLFLADGYKLGHPYMMPENTTTVYANITPRSTHYMPPQAKEIVVFGVHYALQYMQDLFRHNFFSREESDIRSLQRELTSYLGTNYNVDHFLELWRLGFLPLEIKALPEGTIIEEGIPIVSIKNTDPRFFWLVNYVESLLSSLIWKPLHTASIAYGFRKIVGKYKLETDENTSVNYQCHDFSMRGMQHPESAISSGMAFNVVFDGSDTMAVMPAIRYYYNQESSISSVPATEHSIMTSYGKENEFEAFEEMLKRFPTGVLSIVSDSYNLWNVLTDFLPRLKDKIMSRDGKIVIRPDSGNPVDIICGVQTFKDGTYNKNGINTKTTEAERKGVIELLWDIFGGTVNAQGYKVLDPHIGAIYGDAISLDMCEEICERLKQKGFASTNMVFGIGSYSLSYASRDSMGLAMKTTAIEVGSDSFRTELREVYKDPITDNGTKKSLRGLFTVIKDNDKIIVKDRASFEEVEKSMLQICYLDGRVIQNNTFTTIQRKVRNAAFLSCRTNQKN